MLLDGSGCLVYNMLIKEADTIATPIRFRRIVLKNSTFHFVGAGVLFFMVYMVQNRYNQYCKSKQYHERLVCSHKTTSSRSRLGSEVFTPYRLPW